MTRAAAWILLLTFLASAGQGQEAWPTELAGAESIVKSTLGDLPFHRVDVLRRGRTLEISIPLEMAPAQLRSSHRPSDEAAEDGVFLAANFVQPFRDGEEIAEFSLMPANAHLVDHFFGFWIFNFGRQVKFPAEIILVGESGDEEKIRFRKKKFKVKRKSLTLKFIQGQVSAPGFYALHTVVGPHSLTTYFCNSCSP